MKIYWSALWKSRCSKACCNALSMHPSKVIEAKRPPIVIEVPLESLAVPMLATIPYHITLWKLLKQSTLWKVLKHPLKVSLLQCLLPCPANTPFKNHWSKASSKININTLWNSHSSNACYNVLPTHPLEIIEAKHTLKTIEAPFESLTAPMLAAMPCLHTLQKLLKQSPLWKLLKHSLKVLLLQHMLPRPTITPFKIYWSIASLESYWSIL